MAVLTKDNPPSLGLKLKASCWCGRAWIAVLFALLLGMTSAQDTLSAGAAGDPPLKVTEYEAKAAYLYKIGYFVEWPKFKHASDRSPLIIGVLGVDPFGQDLEKTIADETIGDRPILIRRYQTEEEAQAAHILFISSSEKKRIKQIVENLKGKAVLTVSDIEGFCDEGGMVQLNLVENHVIPGVINLKQTSKEKLIVEDALSRLFRKRK